MAYCIGHVIRGVVEWLYGGIWKEGRRKRKTIWNRTVEERRQTKLKCSKETTRLEAECCPLVSAGAVRCDVGWHKDEGLKGSERQEDPQQYEGGPWEQNEDKQDGKRDGAALKQNVMALCACWHHEIWSWRALGWRPEGYRASGRPNTTGRTIASHAVVFRGVVLLSSPQTAFVGRRVIRTPLKTTAWEARRTTVRIEWKIAGWKGGRGSFEAERHGLLAQ